MIEDDEGQQAARLELAVEEARRLAAALVFAADASESGRNPGDGRYRKLRIYDGQELLFEIDVDTVADERHDLELLRESRDPAK
jgi:hypothetical protein